MYKKRDGLIREWEDNFSPLELGEHANLIALVVMPDAGDDECDYKEIIFTVPTQWLLGWLWENDSDHWTEERMREWLKNEYTSEDSKEIFDDAMLERKVITLNVR